MIYIRHYFPGIDLKTLSDEDFAMISEEALWLHSEMMTVKTASTLFAPSK
jgi:hypothetical protein